MKDAIHHRQISIIIENFQDSLEFLALIIQDTDKFSNFTYTLSYCDESLFNEDYKFD